MSRLDPIEHARIRRHIVNTHVRLISEALALNGAADGGTGND